MLSATPGKFVGAGATSCRSFGLGFVVGIGVCAAAAGCKTVYVPNTVNAPLLKEKGELRANLSGSNLQAAYAVADGVGLMANGFLEDSTGDQNAKSGLDGRGYLVEVGGGHFRPVLDQRVIFETYGGLGYGTVRHDNWEQVNGARSQYGFSAKAVKAFLQPSLGFTSTFFDAVAATRFVVLQPFESDSFNYPEARLRADELYDIEKHTFVFFEPAVTIRAGYKWAKLYLQYGVSLKFNDTPLPRDKTFATAGLHLDFAPRF